MDKVEVEERQVPQGMGNQLSSQQHIVPDDAIALLLRAADPFGDRRRFPPARHRQQELPLGPPVLADMVSDQNHQPQL